MDHIEILVEKITDIIIKRLQDEEPKKTVGFLGKEYESVRAYYEKRGYKVISVKDKVDIDVLVVTELPSISMNRIAVGVPQMEDEMTIFQRLMNKKDVIFLEEGMELWANQHIVPKPLLQVLLNYKKQLVSYGVSILPLKNFEKINETINVKIEDKSYKSHKKELITVEKVQKMDLQVGDIFETNKNIIITALAKDYMRDLGVQIV